MSFSLPASQGAEVENARNAHRSCTRERCARARRPLSRCHWLEGAFLRPSGAGTAPNKERFPRGPLGGNPPRGSAGTHPEPSAASVRNASRDRIRRETPRPRPPGQESGRTSESHLPLPRHRAQGIQLMRMCPGRLRSLPRLRVHLGEIRLLQERAHFVCVPLGQFPGEPHEIWLWPRL